MMLTLAPAATIIVLTQATAEGCVRVCGSGVVRWCGVVVGVCGCGGLKVRLCGVTVGLCGCGVVRWCGGLRVRLCGGGSVCPW